MLGGRKRSEEKNEEEEANGEGKLDGKPSAAIVQPVQRGKVFSAFCLGGINHKRERVRKKGRYRKNALLTNSARLETLLHRRKEIAVGRA
jgi:hypothetical protein